MPARTPARRRLASAVAATEKSGGPRDPRLPALRRDLVAAGLEEHIRDAVASWPPLSPETRAELAVLLLNPAGDGDAT